MLWMDQTNSAEILTATMGAAKAGVQIVTFAEKNEQGALHEALVSSGARGIVFSPSSAVTEEESRKALLLRLMPELSSLYPGDALNLRSYPNLKQII